MTNAEIITDFMDSIKAKAKAQKADPYAYTTGYLYSFIHMNMCEDPEVIEKMLKQTQQNYEFAGRAV